MNLKKIICAAMIATVITSCKDPSPKALILYYSQTGTTDSLAIELQRQTGADICRFDVKQAYTDSYEQTIARCLSERKTDFLPDLEPLDIDLSGYDVIFLGYPIWFGTYAPPVKALLFSERLDGKTIVPFCTFGSGGIKSSTEDLRKELPNSCVMDGYGVRAARIGAIVEELNRFLIENGWKEGSIEPLPEFSEQVPVSEKDTAIFNAACSSYKYPIGTPITVGERIIPDGTEYMFAVEGFTPDGQLNSSTVFINVIKGKKPEFTQVIR